MEDIPHVIEVSLFLLIAFLLGCILGWLFRKIRFSRAINGPAPTSASPVSEVKAASSKAADPGLKRQVAANDVAANDVAASAHAAQKPKATPIPQTADKDGTKEDNGARPSTLDQPRDGKKDNLKKIKGVGPKIESVLNELGIYHFDQISKWDQKTVEWVDENLSFKGRINRDGWVEQARTYATDIKATSQRPAGS